MAESKHAVCPADELGSAVCLVRSFTALIAVTSVLQPHVGVPKQAAVIQAPGSCVRLSRLAAKKRCSAADEPSTIFTVHAALGPLRHAMWIPRPLAVGNSVTQWRMIAAINITRLFTLWFLGMSGITANTMARFVAATASWAMFDLDRRLNEICVAD